MQSDESQSWIVISRGMDKYVSELPEENGKSIHCEEVTASTGRPVATKQKEQLIHSICMYSRFSQLTECTLHGH